MPYRIRHWHENFENHKTRVLKTLNWIPITTDLSSAGYAELVAGHERGTAHFGVWLALLEIAAKGTPRGHLSAGSRHYTAHTMALMCRMPEWIIEEALERLVSIGWVETWRSDDDTAPDRGAVAPGEAHQAATMRRDDDDTTRKLTHSETRKLGRTDDNTDGRTSFPRVTDSNTEKPADSASAQAPATSAPEPPKPKYQPDPELVRIADEYAAKRARGREEAEARAPRPGESPAERTERLRRRAKSKLGVQPQDPAQELEPQAPALKEEPAEPEGDAELARRVREIDAKAFKDWSDDDAKFYLETFPEHRAQLNEALRAARGRGLE